VLVLLVLVSLQYHRRRTFYCLLYIWI